MVAQASNIQHSQGTALVTPQLTQNHRPVPPHSPPPLAGSSGRVSELRPPMRAADVTASRQETCAEPKPPTTTPPPSSITGRAGVTLVPVPPTSPPPTDFQGTQHLTENTIQTRLLANSTRETKEVPTPPTSPPPIKSNVDATTRLNHKKKPTLTEGTGSVSTVLSADTAANAGTVFPAKKAAIMSTVSAAEKAANAGTVFPAKKAAITSTVSAAEKAANAKAVTVSPISPPPIDQHVVQHLAHDQSQNRLDASTTSTRGIPKRTPSTGAQGDVENSQQLPEAVVHSGLSECNDDTLKGQNSHKDAATSAGRSSAGFQKTLKAHRNHSHLQKPKRLSNSTTFVKCKIPQSAAVKHQCTDDELAIVYEKARICERNLTALFRFYASRHNVRNESKTFDSIKESYWKLCESQFYRFASDFGIHPKYISNLELKGVFRSCALKVRNCTIEEFAIILARCTKLVYASDQISLETKEINQTFEQQLESVLRALYLEDASWMRLDQYLREMEMTHGKTHNRTRGNEPRFELDLTMECPRYQNLKTNKRPNKPSPRGLVAKQGTQNYEKLNVSPETATKPRRNSPTVSVLKPARKTTVVVHAQHDASRNKSLNQPQNLVANKQLLERDRRHHNLHNPVGQFKSSFRQQRAKTISEDNSGQQTTKNNETMMKESLNSSVAMGFAIAASYDNSIATSKGSDRRAKNVDVNDSKLQTVYNSSKESPRDSSFKSVGSFHNTDATFTSYLDELGVTSNITSWMLSPEIGTQLDQISVPAAHSRLDRVVSPGNLRRESFLCTWEDLEALDIPSSYIKGMGKKPSSRLYGMGETSRSLYDRNTKVDNSTCFPSEPSRPSHTRQVAHKHSLDNTKSVANRTSSRVPKSNSGMQQSRIAVLRANRFKDRSSVNKQRRKVTGNRQKVQVSKIKQRKMTLGSYKKLASIQRNGRPKTIISKVQASIPVNETSRKQIEGKILTTLTRKNNRVPEYSKDLADFQHYVIAAGYQPEFAHSPRSQRRLSKTETASMDRSFRSARGIRKSPQAAMKEDISCISKCKGGLMEEELLTEFVF